MLCHWQAQKNCGGNIIKGQCRAVTKTETAVISWITNQDASLRPQGADRFQSFINQFYTYPLSLQCWEHRNRPERKPLTMRPVDRDRGECNMPHDFPFNLSDQ